MSDVVISVENLWKTYLIGHNARRESYTALRDVIARHAHNLVRKTARHGHRPRRSCRATRSRSSGR